MTTLEQSPKDGATVALAQQERIIPPQGVGGYDQCWYPLALSSELERKQILGVGFLNGQVAVYRGQDGKARVVSAYCRHLGANLSVGGTVVGEEIRCPFHHWRYEGETGRCTHIPSQAHIPPAAQLFAYPTAEAWGIIWAFNGETPLYEVPHLPEPEAFYLTMAERTLHYPGTPHWLMISNSLDFQHLRILHEFKVNRLPEEVQIGAHTFAYDVEIEIAHIGAMNQSIKVFGTNCFTLGGVGPVNSIVAGRPLPDGGTQMYAIHATPQADLPGMPDAQARLGFAKQFFDDVSGDDNPVMLNMRFREDVLVDVDRHLQMYFDYVRHYPRANPGAALIS